MTDTTPTLHVIVHEQGHGELQSMRHATTHQAEEIARYYLGHGAESVVSEALVNGSSEGQRGAYIVQVSVEVPPRYMVTRFHEGIEASAAPARMLDLDGQRLPDGSTACARVTVRPLIGGGASLSVEYGWREADGSDGTSGDFYADTAIEGLNIPREAWALLNGQPF